MPFSRIFASSILVLSAAFMLPSAVQAQTTVTPPEDGHGIGSELIRHHRLKHLDAKLGVDPAVLKEQCRYESEISSAPPPRQVALTFDDGPEPGQTEFILETLRRYRIPGAFFVVGHKVQQHPELLEQIRREGHHIIGNHSWDHPNFHAIDVAAQTEEVERARAALALPGTHGYFRYPFGNSTCDTNNLVRSMGYSIVGWHIDSCDWAFDVRGKVDSKEAMICGVLPQYRQDFVGHVVSTVRAHNGGIVLLHEIHPKTTRQLESIIQRILAEGYTFASLADPAFVPSMR